jgi:hypothetical protein
MSMKNSNDTIGNRTRYLPACRAVLQPTAPPHAPTCIEEIKKFFFQTFGWKSQNVTSHLRDIDIWIGRHYMRSVDQFGVAAFSKRGDRPLGFLKK